MLQYTCNLISGTGDCKRRTRTGTAPSDITSFLKNICLGCNNESSGVDAMRGPGAKYDKIRAINS
jgi:hypothetical protein